MLSTALSFLAAVALLIPGFIITEVSRDKSSQSPQHDLELALRSLAYTLFVQLIFGAWTAHLVKTLGPSTEWADHLGAISAYLAVVVLGAPIAFGLALSAYLNRVELRDGPPSTFANALGAGRARDAFDYAYQRWRKEGVYVIVELLGHTTSAPRLVGGIYGKRSAVGQTPEPHDIYLEALCTVAEGTDGVRSLVARVEPDQGVYIPAQQIARVDLVPAEPDTLQS